MAFELKDGLTLAVAAVGAGLGIINTLHNLDQQKVKLRVVPKVAQRVIGGIVTATTLKNGFPGPVLDRGCIEVVNLSAFPVTVQEIGFTPKGNNHRGFRLAFTDPIVEDGKPFPRRLEPRESFTGYFPMEDLKGQLDRAYATTECGVTLYGTSPIMKEVFGKRG